MMYRIRIWSELFGWWVFLWICYIVVVIELYYNLIDMNWRRAGEGDEGEGKHLTHRWKEKTRYQKEIKKFDIRIISPSYLVVVWYPHFYTFGQLIKSM